MNIIFLLISSNRGTLARNAKCVKLLKCRLLQLIVIFGIGINAYVNFHNYTVAEFYETI